MGKKDRTDIFIKELQVVSGKNNPDPFDYDLAKIMVPIYVFHRSQGADEKEAAKKAFDEISGILKCVSKKRLENPDQSWSSESE